MAWVSANTETAAAVMASNDRAEGLEKRCVGEMGSTFDSMTGTNSVVMASSIGDRVPGLRSSSLSSFLMVGRTTIIRRAPTKAPPRKIAAGFESHATA
ncbi:hypothetical protein A6I89_07640 [Prescottella equi]|nr:hypothetical protein A6I89_07640 [Prescottella equi]